MPKTVRDLMRVTGLSEPSTYLGLELGALPGYRVGRRWVIPDEAFDDFLHGRWQPIRRDPFPDGIKPLPQPEHFVKRRDST